MNELNWPVKVYRKEHDKIIDLMQKLQSLCHRYFESQGREKRLMCLELIEKQVTLRHVVEHHEQREEQDALKIIQCHTDLQKHHIKTLLGRLKDWTDLHEPTRQRMKNALTDFQ